MNHISKSIFVTLMLTMILTITFGQKIVELKIDPKTGDLSYPNTPRVGLFGGVVWVIKDPQIKSFQIVEKPGNPRYIFTEPLPTVQVPILRRKLNFQTRGFEWEYGIKWIDKATEQSHYYDPKIAVKPLVSLAELLLLLGFIVTLITSIVFFRKWRSAEAKLAKNSQQNK